MKKSDLVERIKRNLGYPLVKIELDAAQINDAIDYTRARFIRWACGQATSEYYFTLMLSAGETMYDLPSRVTEVIGYEVRTSGSIHTLFTMENYLYNAGMYDMMLMRSGGTGGGYDLVSYHIARDFLDTIRRYIVDAYSFKYHPYTNQLEIWPVPPSGGTVWANNMGYNSPGYVLVRSYMIEGLDTDIYETMWVQDYATAYCKRTLGRVRSKFANFASIGQTGIALDGDALISEATAEMEKLDEQLRTEESWVGYDITIG